MANKKVNFLSQLKKLGNKDLSGNNNYPSKKQINFITAEKKVVPVFYKVVIVGVLIFIIVLLKFFVIDLIRETYESKRVYTDLESKIEMLKKSDTNAKHIKEEYNRYGNGYLTREEKDMTDRMEIFEVINSRVQPYAKIESVEITGNEANINIEKTSLETLSSIVAKVEEDKRVSFATVTTAGTEKEYSSVIATIEITFKSGGAE